MVCWFMSEFVCGFQHTCVGVGSWNSELMLKIRILCVSMSMFIIIAMTIITIITIIIIIVIIMISIITIIKYYFILLLLSLS